MSKAKNRKGVAKKIPAQKNPTVTKSRKTSTEKNQNLKERNLEDLKWKTLDKRAHHVLRITMTEQLIFWT